MANSAAMKMIVGSTWKAKIRTYLGPSAPSVALITRSHAGRSPRMPKTKAEPTSANDSSFVTAAPSVSKTRWPIVVLRTISAKTICRLMPQPTVRQSMARRADELR